MKDNNIVEFNKIENVSDEFTKAYVDAATDNTPDLWDRIELGFDKELEDMGITTSSGKGRKVVFSRRLGMIAAIVLTVIIAVPVISKVGFNNKKSDNVSGVSESVKEESAIDDLNDAEFDQAADSDYNNIAQVENSKSETSDYVQPSKATGASEDSDGMELEIRGEAGAEAYSGIVNADIVVFVEDNVYKATISEIYGDNKENEEQWILNSYTIDNDLDFDQMYIDLFGEAMEPPVSMNVDLIFFSDGSECCRIVKINK